MNRILFFALLGFVMVSFSMADEGYQLFRDTQGREIEARIVNYDSSSNKITVQLKNGKKSTVDLSIFCEVDQVKIKDWHISEEMFSPQKLVVNIDKKTIRSDSYHKEVDGWQSHYPGMKFEDVAFEVSLSNRGKSALEDITVDYCIFTESERKEKSGESELRDLSDGSKAWFSVQQSNTEVVVVPRMKRSQFSIASLQSRDTIESLTETVQLREGTESSHGSPRGDRRKYKIREVEDEIDGIIIRISVSLPSGSFVRKEYSYPSDFLKKEGVDWSTPMERSDKDTVPEGAPMMSKDEETKNLQRINELMRNKEFNEAVTMSRQLYESGDDLQYHGAWRLGEIYLSFDNPERNIGLGVEWMLKASKGGFAGPYHDLAEFYACDPDPAVRDGRNAVKYAALAMDCYGETPAPGAYQIMACALARDGQFQDAIDMINKAIAGMKEREGQGSRQQYLREYEQMLAHFRSRQAWPN